MKLFIDSANLEEIEAALERGIIQGVTTNPSILAKEERVGFEQLVGSIVALLKRYGACIPLSVEVFASDPDEMVRQAAEFVSQFDYPEIVIKIPIGWQELRAIGELGRRSIPVNCTCCMTTEQALLAATAGAKYVSLFYGRIRDSGQDPARVVAQTRQIFEREGIASEILIGSIRETQDVTDALVAGAHIVTIPPKFLPLMAYHPKSEEAVGQFLGDFARWINEPAQAGRS